MSKTISLYREGDPFAPPPDRGRLMSAEQVASDLMPQGIDARYVRRHVHPRVTLGRKVFFYELDVRRWLEAQREEEAAS